MKKIIIALCIAVFSIVNSIAQDKTLGIFGSIGYGFGIGGQLYPTTRYTDNNLVSRNDQYFNLGRGFKIDFGFDYFAMDNVSIQGAMAFSVGVPSFKFDSSTTENARKVNTEYKPSTFGIKVLVVPRFEILELLDMYVGVGTGLYFGKYEYEYTSRSTENVITSKGVFKTTPSLGFLGQIGFDYPILDMMSIYSEIGFDMMSFALTSKKVDEASPITDDNKPNSIIPIEKDITNGRIDPIKIPGSNMQLRLGVRMGIF